MTRAHFVTEQTTHKQKVLIVAEEQDIFVKELKRHLVEHDMRVFVSPYPPEDLSGFSLCFIVSHKTRRKHLSIPAIYIVFTRNKKHTEKNHLLSGSKQILVIGTPEYAISQIQTIIWFAISHESHSPLLTLESMSPIITKPKQKKIQQFHFSFSPHLLRLFAFLLVISYLFSFWLPLAGASYLSYISMKRLKSGDVSGGKKANDNKEGYIRTARFLYYPVRPLYLFFSLAQFPDDLFVINETSTTLLQTLEKLSAETQSFSQLILEKTRNKAIAQSTRIHYDIIEHLLVELGNQLLTLYRKIPPTLISRGNKDEFQKVITQLRKAKKVFSLLPILLGEREPQKILLLFANNMELRPGGGFIGSYGVLKTAYFGLQDLQIYDVYDADGQLTGHIDPPLPIRNHLNQPHWFLRDSAFFPDFFDTYQQATFFLQKEMGLSDWNGAALITTTAVKNIIGAFDEVILPDYNERITQDNFYIKTQHQVENKFFPGSTQKKNFLSAVVRQLMTQMEFANPLLLSTAIVEGFDEKNVVLFINNETVQKSLDELFWSGRLATPFCPESAKDNCFADFQFAMDANLGVNKTNFFIDKTYDVATSIDDSGLTSTQLTITFANTSLNGVFPGGPYKNYFQILLPTESVVQEVRLENNQLTSYDSETGKHKMIGFLIEILPQEQKTLSIKYTSLNRYKPGKAIYQLVLQKQIGALSQDVHFSLQLPSNMNLLNTNFSPLVKNNLILYNTDLSTDRVFFIELLKEQL